MRLLVLSILPLLAACSGNAPKPADANTGDVAVAVADAAAPPPAAAGAAPASHVPDYVALPPGARILSRTDTSTKAMQGGNLVLESRQSPAQTLDFYRDAVQGSGMQITVEGLDADGAMLMASSPDGRHSLSLLVNRTGAGLTRVTMTHNQPAS